MYVVFYYTYMPNVTHVRPVHLQFKSCEENMGICSFPSAHVQLTKRSHMLMAAQPYRIKLILEMPESQINKDLGMFMVCAQMRAKGGVLVSSSCRSAMLRYSVFPPLRCDAALTSMVLEKLNDEQMEILLDFADRCRYLCFGRPPTGRDADIIAFKQWKELSRDLNYAGNLPWKNGREWKMYWTELKTKTKAKLAAAKRRSKTTGEPLNLNNFNFWEQRIIELADLVAKEPRTKQVFSENGDGDTTESILNDMICEPKFESTPNTSQNGVSAVDAQVTPLDMTNTFTTQLQPDAPGAPDEPDEPDAPHAPLQYVSIGTQMIATPGIKKSMPPPILHGYSPMSQFIPIPPGVSVPPPAPPAPPTAAQYQQRTRQMPGIHSTPTNNTSTGQYGMEGGAEWGGGGDEGGAGGGLSALSAAVQALARANMSIADSLMALSSRVANK
ncbi:hypothetical protein O0L34_g18858 [Tuta absoluta]|nr:hypothetical protein O0L34_g18858 [Tuta absoluta]